VEEEKIIEELRKLTPQEREKLMEKVEEEGKPPYILWGANPLAIKATLKTIELRGSVTYRELRETLRRDIDPNLDEEEKYSFGIIPDNGEGNLFRIEKKQEKRDWKITLTPSGQKIAQFLDDDFGKLHPHEIVLFRGLQPHAPGITVLELLIEAGEKGILNEELVKEMKRRYGKAGEHYLGYFKTWYRRLGLIKAEQDTETPRCKRFFYNPPSASEFWKTRQEG